jgi:hypothetical protein
MVPLSTYADVHVVGMSTTFGATSRGARRRVRHDSRAAAASNDAYFNGTL